MKTENLGRVFRGCVKTGEVWEKSRISCVCDMHGIVGEDWLRNGKERRKEEVWLSAL